MGRCFDVQRTTLQPTDFDKNALEDDSTPTPCLALVVIDGGWWIVGLGDGRSVDSCFKSVYETCPFLQGAIATSVVSPHDLATLRYGLMGALGATLQEFSLVHYKALATSATSHEE